MYEEHIAREEVGGFIIDFYACEEYTSPRGQFQNEDGSDDEETIGRIRDGTYAWFCAKVTASRAGVVLGTDYLGGCCYDSPQQFWDMGDGYYKSNMIAAAIAEAVATIEALNQARIS